MLQKMSLIALSATLLANCSATDPGTIIETEYIEQRVPVQARPQGVDLADVEFRVVNQDNLEEFLEDIRVGDKYVFVAITVRDYEKLSLNVAELRRYIAQQQELIVYYERAVTE